MAWATAYAGFWAVTGDIRVRFRQPLNVGEQTVVTGRVSGTRGRIVTTSAEMVLDRNQTLIPTATAMFVKVGADAEAVWRARYVRAANTVQAESRDDLRSPPDRGPERNSVSQSGKGSRAPDHDH